MGRIILVTGGARSGKSRFAEQLAADLGGRIAYIATARALDAEMADRIARHQQQRPAAWPTFEAPLSAPRSVGWPPFDAATGCVSVTLSRADEK